MREEFIRGVIETTIRNHPKECEFLPDAVNKAVKLFFSKYNTHMSNDQMIDLAVQSIQAQEIYCPHEGIDRREKMMNDKPGPTGKFPDGKLTSDDRGELQVGMRSDDKGNVIISFGTPVEWVALPADQAIEFGRMIMEQGYKAKGLRGKVKRIV